MNTTMITSSAAPIPSQPLAHYNPEVEQRVQQWLASRQLLVWIPILSLENFPGVPPQVLQFADWTTDVMQQRQDAMLKKLEAHWRLQDRKSKADLAGALLSNLEKAGDAVIFELESSRHGLTATAQEDGKAFIVLAGSHAKLDWTGQPHSYQQLRDDLRDSGALKLADDGTHLLFGIDTVFKSPSAASATVLGRTDNGRNTWRLKGSSITYAAWQDNLPGNQPASGRSEL